MSKDVKVERVVVTLAECPPGPFLFDGSVLGFKTEYGMAEVDENGAAMPGSKVRWRIGNRPDAYVLATGECFWGGAKSHDERSSLLVEPLDAARFESTLRAPAGDVREVVAKALCDNIDARLLAEKEGAPSFDDSTPHVQDYWRALAGTPLLRQPEQGREGECVGYWTYKIEDGRETDGEFLEIDITDADREAGYRSEPLYRLPSAPVDGDRA